MAATLTTFDFGEDGEYHKKNRKQSASSRSSSSLSHEVQKQMELLNALFYDSHLLTGRELFEILQEQLCDPYQIGLEKVHGKLALVVYPKMMYNNVAYIQELDQIARQINDVCNVSQTKGLLKNMSLQKGGISTPLIIPLQDVSE